MSKRARNRPMRSGYTTGACAAAAAKGAALALLRQEAVSSVQIDLPGNARALFKITRCVFDTRQAECSVVKDAGDDPDVTNGAEIRAAVAWQDVPGVSICGGEGVGTVTKPGLEIPAGMAAINPAPRRMIAAAVLSVINGQEGRGARVTVSVPAGLALARKTLNRRLGIVGGISILGTTGIVIPYSVEAYQASISQSVDIARAGGQRQVVLTTGRRSEKYAQNALALAEECYVQAGDFIGYSLEQCAQKGISRVTIWGMTGKMSKLAAGHFYTNISDSRVDIRFLADIAAGCGVPEEKLQTLQGAVTANHLRKLLPAGQVRCFCDRLCRRAAEQCRAHAGGNLAVTCVLSDYDGVVLGKSHGEA